MTSSGAATRIQLVKKRRRLVARRRHPRRRRRRRGRPLDADATAGWSGCPRPSRGESRRASSPRKALLDLRIGGDAAGRGVYVQRSSELLVAESRLWEVLHGDCARASGADDRAAPAPSRSARSRCERHGAGWRVVEPRPALADPRAGAALLGPARARARRLLRAGPAPSPAPNEDLVTFDRRLEARIRWQGGGNLPQVIRATARSCASRRRPWKRLAARLDELRQRHSSSLRLEESTPSIRDRGKKLSLRHADHAWSITAPPEAAGPAEDGLVRERLRGLLELRGRAVGAPGAPVLGSLRLAGAADAVELTLTGAATRWPGCASRRTRRCSCPGSRSQLFDPDPLLLRSERVDTFRPDQVSSRQRRRRRDQATPRSSRRSPICTPSGCSSGASRCATRCAWSPAGSAHTYLARPSDRDGCLVRTSDERARRS